MVNKPTYYGKNWRLGLGDTKLQRWNNIVFVWHLTNHVLVNKWANKTKPHALFGVIDSYTIQRTVEPIIIAMFATKIASIKNVTYLLYLLFCRLIHFKSHVLHISPLKLWILIKEIFYLRLFCIWLLTCLYPIILWKS